MPTIISQLDPIFRTAIKDAFNVDADPQLGLSQSEQFGDYQSNVAMGLAKPLSESTGKKQNPRGIAEQIKANLRLAEIASEITIAGPGFINVRLSPAWLAKQLELLTSDDRLGITPVTHPQVVIVDYSGPNIAKEMHVGHLRSTIIGDAISRVLEFQGQKIIRQNHIGDWGTQFGKVTLAIWYMILSESLGQKADLNSCLEELKIASTNKNDVAKGQAVHKLVALHQHWLDEDPDGSRIFQPALERLALELAPLERIYQFVSSATEVASAKQEMIRDKDGVLRSLADIPRHVTTFIQDPENHKQEELAWKKAREATLKTCNEIYSELGVKLRESDIRGESFYRDQLAATVTELKDEHIAVESQGAVVIPIEGFEAPLMIQKSDGGYLYGTTDLAAIRFRTRELKANRIIYTHDSRQQQHFAQVFWTAQKIGWAKDVKLDYAPFGTMLGEDGKPFKSRSGDTVKLKELLDESIERALKVVTDKNPELPDAQRQEIARAVGIGAVKYSDLAKDRISDYLFSFDKMLALDGNTAPYIQYAHARIRSIFRKAGHFSPGAIQLESPYELAIAKHILRLGEVLDLVARELKPHHLCTYLYELATRFSGFFENCPVIQSPEPTRTSRLMLCDLIARTLELGLDLLGIGHPDQM